MLQLTSACLKSREVHLELGRLSEALGGKPVDAIERSTWRSDAFAVGHTDVVRAVDAVVSCDTQANSGVEAGGGARG